MRFSDLKKKFPSLRVGVLVIAAFALLGSMMLPSISEKMGLDEGLCVADEGYWDGYEQRWVDEYDSDSWDPFTEMLDCIDDADTRRERVISVFDAYCAQQYEDDESGYETCKEVFEASTNRLYLEKAGDCIDTLEMYEALDEWLELAE